MNGVQITYDRPLDVLFIEMPGVNIETRAEVDTLFDFIHASWKRLCKGRKVYFVVCYDNFAINLEENAHYAERMSQVVAECAVTAVRYGGDSFQRTAARLRGIQAHMPSNLYDSREHALEVVAAIRAGSMTLGSPPPLGSPPTRGGGRKPGL